MIVFFSCLCIWDIIEMEASKKRCQNHSNTEISFFLLLSDNFYCAHVLEIRISTANYFLTTQISFTGSLIFFVTLEQVIVTSMEAYLHSSKMRKTLYFKLISSDRLFEHWIDDSFDGYYFGWRNACWGWRSHVGKVRSSFVFYEVEPRLVESIYNMIWIRQLHASSQPAIKPSSENLLSIEMNDVNNSGIKMYFSL